MKTLQQTLDYWKNPDEQNDPLKYLDGYTRTDFLVNKVERFCDKDDFIFELGCNIGRNLNGLWNKQFKYLWGIDINQDAIELSFKLFYDMAIHSSILPVKIEDYLKEVNEVYFQIIFTMAVLCHIHPDIENIVFDNMVRVSEKYILIIEDEFKVSDRHFPRNYQEIFESRGMRQIESQRCHGIVGLGNNYVYRMFEK